MMRANSVQKFAIFLGFRAKVVFINLNCSFDYNFPAFSNEFLDVSQFENYGIKIICRNLGVKLHAVARVDLCQLFIWHSFGTFSLFLDSTFKHDKHKKMLFSNRVSNFPRVS